MQQKRYFKKLYWYLVVISYISECKIGAGLNFVVSKNYFKKLETLLRL